jgi:hypothetical protein
MSLWVENLDEMRQSSGVPAAAPKGADPLRVAAYWLIAAAALITGFLLSRSEEQAMSGSRVEWPTQTPSKPHPRSLQP